MGQIADEAFLKGDPIQVMRACSNRAQALEPNNSRLLAEHARACFAAGDRAQAEAALAAAERSDRYDATTYRLMAEAWLKVGEKAPIPDLLQKAKERKSKWQSPLYEFANLLMEHGLHAEARTTMESAFRQESDAESALDFARSCLRAGRKEDVAEWCCKAVNVRKREPRTWHALALILAEFPAPAGPTPAVPLPLPTEVTPTFFLQDPRSLLLTCKDAYRPRKERDSRLFAEDGLIHLAAGDRAGAEACFRKAIQEDAEDGNAFAIMGEAWLRAGQHPEALAAFAKMQRVDAKAGSTFMKAALLLLEAGEEAAAVALMEKGSRLEPTAWAAPSEFGKAALALGKRELAATWFARSLAAAPGDWSAWNAVGMAHSDLRLKGSLPPPPPPPKAHALWFQAGLPMDAPTLKSGFPGVYPDPEALASEVARQVKVARPETRELTGVAPSAEDRVLSLQRFQIEGGTRLEGRRLTSYEDATFILTCQDGAGHLLRTLTFRDSTEPGRAQDLPQVNLAGAQPEAKARPLKAAVDSALQRLTRFLASPAFEAWVD